LPAGAGAPRFRPTSRAAAPYGRRAGRWPARRFHPLADGADRPSEPRARATDGRLVGRDDRLVRARAERDRRRRGRTPRRGRGPLPSGRAARAARRRRREPASSRR
jgi:hypothetical protein